MFTYDFLGYDDLYLVGVIALVLVLRNLWDFVRYGYAHSEAETPHLAAHPLATVSAIAAKAYAAALFPHARRAVARPLMRRRPAPLALRPGHRPVKPQQAR